MSKRQVLMILGIWTMVFMFIGLPFIWLNVLAVLTGAIIVCITMTLRQEVDAHPAPQQQSKQASDPVPASDSAPEDNQQ